MITRLAEWCLPRRWVRGWGTGRWERCEFCWGSGELGGIINGDVITERCRDCDGSGRIWTDD